MFTGEEVWCQLFSKPGAGSDLVGRWVEGEALRLTNVRAGQNRRAGNPGPEGSIAKLAFAEVNMDIYELCVELGLPGDVRVDKHLPWSKVPRT